MSLKAKEREGRKRSQTKAELVSYRKLIDQSSILLIAKDGVRPEP